MTREEAKQVFLSRGYVEVEGGTIYEPDKWRESCRVISEWLEQQSCEDCISRQAVLDQTYLWSKDEFLRVTNPFDYLRKRINSLPPVTPQLKTGHWIEDEYEMEVRCSECGEENDECSKYCPKCGAKMQTESDIKQGLNYADEDTLMPAT